jgi:RimJ/RimL family protein N-acetyltransferase
LVGRTVRLDVASEHDAEGLFSALDDDRVWEMGYGGSAPRPTSASAWRQAIAKAANDERVMYIVRAVDEQHPRDGRIIGTTSLGDLDLANEKVHLGWTAYTPDVWSTTVNPECKLLLLWHCFEHCGLGRVKIRTDIINVRSQAAIAKLGATREGVARRHIKRADGTWRDSVVFSVIIDDWARVKSGLEARLASGQK